MDIDRTLSSENLPFLEAIYEQYRRDPASVDSHWHEALELLGQPATGGTAPRRSNGAGNGATAGAPITASPATAAHSPDAQDVTRQHAVDDLIEHYRMQGHLAASLDPLGRPRDVDTSALSLTRHGLGDNDLERSFDAGGLFSEPRVTLRRIVERLRKTYCRGIGVEYWNISDLDRRAWLREQMEPVQNEVVPSEDEQRRLLRSLARVDEADRFLHQKFLGAKRFSVAGGESVIALLETLIEEAGDRGIEEIVMGMAHRGRLAVMMNILDKSPMDIMSEFEKGDPWANLGGGDVKYHKGSHRQYRTRAGKEIYLALAFNPSHLEAITPVISGRVRASQDQLGDTEGNRVLGVTMHGDAAVMGQGVYAETLNLSRLAGYSTGGTIRVVINNQIGFTTDPEESRSTNYCTAVADMLGVPILHVNGDDPEGAAYAARLALAYRQRFHTDVIIDLVCYRKFGHNEGDEPTFTQPEMYELIKDRVSVRDLYQQRLLERGTVSQADCEAMDRELHDEFEHALAEVRKHGPDKSMSPMHGVWEDYQGGADADSPEADTSISQSDVDAVRSAVVNVPDGFGLHRKLARQLKEIGGMLRDEAPLNWAAAEYLAYGSLLRAGHSVRLSGQDCVRGTFGHRHIGWTDGATGARYFPLQHLSPDQGRLQVINSPLSEFAVLGFEFGYSLAAPSALLIWEAQFGDFANGAQVIIDQFISSCEDKWNRISGLALMLPHGYEGQGPEHSSARFERFLQLCAEDNMQVCNLTTPAQMFHVLRRQVLRRYRKPLVIMTPKSLLRARPSFSPLSEFTNGSFQRLIDDVDVDPAAVSRVIFCTGRLYYDLHEARVKRERSDVAIIRVEQLYPFPAQQIADALARYPGARSHYWVQDEPRNMGAWFFCQPRIDDILGDRGALHYVGRVDSASPATGSPESHKLELEMMLEETFKP